MSQIEWYAFGVGPQGWAQTTWTSAAGAGLPQQINNLGDVGGWVLTDQQGYTMFYDAYMWRPADGTTEQLPKLPGGTSAKAMDVNDARQVAGWSTTSAGYAHAVLWTLR